MVKWNYSVRSLIVENEKTIKGMLILSDDQHEFYGIQKHTDWKIAFYISDVPKVKKFVSLSYKPFVIIREGNTNGPSFIV